MTRRRPVAVLGSAVNLVALLAGNGLGASSEAGTDAPHLIGVRLVDGVAELYDRRDDRRFVPRGANYVFRPVSDAARSLNLFRPGGYDPARVRDDFAALAERAISSRSARVVTTTIADSLSSWAEPPTVTG